MRSSILLVLLPSLALAAPYPQDIDLDAVDAAPDPVIVTPAVDVVAQTATAAPIAQQTESAAAAIATDPATGSTSASKRDLLETRDGSCAKQPKGAGPVISPDTVDAFMANTDLSNAALNAITPDGYSRAFLNLQGATAGSNFLMLYTLTSYDTLTCQSKCDQDDRCVAFNVYVERDPSLDPNAQKCPNPPSTVNYKCTTFGVPISQEGATNTGQWRDSFQVVMTGSNGYNKNVAPPAIKSFGPPIAFGGAINAPLNAQGHDTYVGFKYYPFSQSQGYTPGTCASACNAQTAYNKAHPASDGSYKSCSFFNSYVLSRNGIAQGLYCSMYTQAWAASYATNYGQYRGSDRYTVSESYGYSSAYCSTVPSPGANFNLVDNQGNYLGQRYASASFFYHSAPSAYQYHLDNDGTLTSTSSDHFCVSAGQGLGGTAFLHNILHFPSQHTERTLSQPLFSNLSTGLGLLHRASKKMEKKTWKMLENNLDVMDRLAAKLGLSSSLQFYDVYSLDDPELLAHIPRPALALLVIIPLTAAWDQNRKAEDEHKEVYTGCGPDEPVIWFKQTIGHACGSIGLLHSLINGPAVDFIKPHSDLSSIRTQAIPLDMTQRADMLYNNDAFEIAHKSVQEDGDSLVDSSTERNGGHFVSFVKSGGKLWELEGSRKGPLERGSLGEDEDVLSPRALELGIKRIIALNASGDGGDDELRFSCMALARRV
ncbi:ubiquitin carboxyl-terminal hydrolase, partial [Aureobasidium melanogenum]